MIKESVFLRAIIEDPNDDLSKLAYSDFLEEQGKLNKALAIRWLIKSKRIPDKYEWKQTKTFTYDWWDEELWHTYTKKVQDIERQEDPFLLPNNVFKHLKSKRLKNIDYVGSCILRYREYLTEKGAWIDMIKATTKAIELGELKYE